MLSQLRHPPVHQLRPHRVLLSGISVPILFNQKRRRHIQSSLRHTQSRINNAHKTPIPTATSLPEKDTSLVETIVTALSLTDFRNISPVLTVPTRGIAGSKSLCYSYPAWAQSGSPICTKNIAAVFTNGNQPMSPPSSSRLIDSKEKYGHGNLNRINNL